MVLLASSDLTSDSHLLKICTSKTLSVSVVFSGKYCQILLRNLSHDFAELLMCFSYILVINTVQTQWYAGPTYYLTSFPLMLRIWDVIPALQLSIKFSLSICVKEMDNLELFPDRIKRENRNSISMLQHF